MSFSRLIRNVFLHFFILPFNGTVESRYTYKNKFSMYVETRKVSRYFVRVPRYLFIYKNMKI